MLVDDGLLPESFLEQIGQARRLGLKVDNHSKWHQRYAYKFLKFAIKLCRLRLDQNYDKIYQLDKVQRNGTADSAPADRRRIREPIWSVFLCIFYVYFTFKLIYITYNQYILDFHLYKLEKFDRTLESFQGYGESTMQQIETTRNQLVIQYEEARRTLKRIGAPYMNVHYVIENGFIFLVIVCYAIYMNFVIYYNLCKPFDFSIVYTVLAPGRLQHSTNFIVHNQVNKFIISSRNYNELLMDQEESNAVRLQWRQEELRHREAKSATEVYLDLGSDEDEKYYEEQIIHRDSLKIESETNRIVKNHTSFVELVKTMAADGKFQPFNRRPEWLMKIADIYCWVTLMTYCAVMCSLFVIMFFSRYIPFFIAFDFETDPLDLLFQAELFLYASVMLISSTLFLTIMSMMCLDQEYLAKSLIALIKQCIADNTHIMRDLIDNGEMRVYINPMSSTRCMSLAVQRRKSLLRPPIRNLSMIDQSVSTRTDLIDNYDNYPVSRSYLLSPNNGPKSDRFNHVLDCDISGGGIYYELIDKTINVSLMHTLMHYKIFVRQLRPVLDSFPFYITTITIMMYISIVIPRVLIAYLDGVRIAVSLLVAAVAVILCHIVLLLVCFMHSRCLCIYRHLQSLLAHTISVDHIVKDQLGHKVYDRHLIWMLRKELNHPDRLTDQFTVHLMAKQSRLTFSSLMRYDFWWGVVAISTVIFDPTIPNASDIFGGAWKFYSDADKFVDQFFRGNSTM